MVLTDLVPLSAAVFIASPWNDRWYDPNECRNPLGGQLTIPAAVRSLNIFSWNVFESTRCSVPKVQVPSQATRASHISTTRRERFLATRALTTTTRLFRSIALASDRINSADLNPAKNPMAMQGRRPNCPALVSSALAWFTVKPEKRAHSWCR